jgi:hypothetical protein
LDKVTHGVGFHGWDVFTRDLSHYRIVEDNVYCTPHGIQGQVKSIIGLMAGGQYDARYCHTNQHDTSADAHDTITIEYEFIIIQYGTV